MMALGRSPRPWRVTKGGWLWSRACAGIPPCRLALGAFGYRQALPLHPHIEHSQNEIKEAMIAQFALRTPVVPENPCPLKSLTYSPLTRILDRHVLAAPGPRSR